MIIIQQSASSLKRFLANSGLNDFARLMVTRMVLAFILQRGRMSCSSAAGVIASEPIHCRLLTRFLARPRWQKEDFNSFGRAALLQMETGKGKFVFIIDATMFSQAGKKTQNVYSTGNRQRRPKKGRRYNNKKVCRKNVHSFTFGLLITPSGYRIPFQIPHYTKEYCKKKGIAHLTTAEAAAKMIRELPLDEEAEVLVVLLKGYPTGVEPAPSQKTLGYFAGRRAYNLHYRLRRIFLTLASIFDTISAPASEYSQSFY